MICKSSNVHLSQNYNLQIKFLEWFNSGSSSIGAPSSVGAVPSSIGESLTSDSSISDVNAQNMTNFSSVTTDQLIADGIIAEDEPGTLPHVIVIYLVSVCISFLNQISTCKNLKV